MPQMFVEPPYHRQARLEAEKTRKATEALDRRLDHLAEATTTNAVTLVTIERTLRRVADALERANELREWERERERRDGEYD